MIKIGDIKELNFTITWRMLYKGILRKQLAVEEVVEYAIEQLENGNDRMEVCELAGGRNDDINDVLNVLYDLAVEENSQDEFEDRKLRAIIVNQYLQKKSSNCIDGLMDLTDLWIELGCPKDSPHIIQGKNNKISPIEYYTDDNYHYLFERNKKWLKNEIDFILAYQKQEQYLV